MESEQAPTSVKDQIDAFQQMLSYPWDKDPDFQDGLSNILGTSSSPSQVEDLTLQAQCFYYSLKTSTSVDFDAYKAYIASKRASASHIPNAPPSQPETDATPNSDSVRPPHHEADQTPAEIEQSDASVAPYPATFAEIVSLITLGKIIPGVKEIPATVLADQATKPVANKRRKPWEKDDAVIEGKEGGIGGTFGDRRDEIIDQELPDA